MNFKGFLLVVLISFVSMTTAFSITIFISASESDAAIYVDGEKLGIGSVEIKLKSNQCKNIRVEKIGYLVVERKFCSGGSYPKLPKTYHFELEEDAAWNSSISTDIANVWVAIKVKEGSTELDAWKLLGQIITDYFDVIEITDRETGYLRTSWELKSFDQNTIRSRVILKLGSSSPLIYKVKLVSEASGRGGTSVKQDENYKEWDRILRKYKDLVETLQNRL